MQTDRTSISAKVLADSIHGRSRLTTFEIVFPRYILAEFNTHRILSKNSASSRAIPVRKRLADVLENPVVPHQLGKNKAGMQSAETISDEDMAAAREVWLIGRDIAVLQAFQLAGGEVQILKDAKDDLRAQALCDRIHEMQGEYRQVASRMPRLWVGIHKQHANRVLEPYAWHTVITTGTSWRNFYALRASKMAQPEIQEVAIAMARAQMESVPQELEHGEWHLPFINDQDRVEVGEAMTLARISSARCARVSYLTHDGKRSLDKDLSMADDLQKNGHMSPFEHPATTHDTTGAYFGSYHGNFSRNWMQYRKMLQNEHDFSQFISPADLLEGMKGDQKLVDFVLALDEWHP